MVYEGEKVAGTIAEIIEPMLSGGTAEYTPQYGETHWSLDFGGLDEQDIRILLSKFAKFVLK